LRFPQSAGSDVAVQPGQSNPGVGRGFWRCPAKTVAIVSPTLSGVSSHSRRLAPAVEHFVLLHDETSLVERSSIASLPASDTPLGARRRLDSHKPIRILSRASDQHL
jgi:hypothetical protein